MGEFEEHSDDRPQLHLLQYETSRGTISLERRGGEIIARFPISRLAPVLSIWITALLISIGLCSGLLWILFKAFAWQNPDVVCAMFAFILLAAPVVMSLFWAVINLVRGVTECIVIPEVRVRDRCLWLRIPGTCRALQYDWERGEIENLRLIRPKRRRMPRTMELWVLSDDGHEARIKLPWPGEESAASVEQALRGALGLGDDIDWGPPSMNLAGA